MVKVGGSLSRKPASLKRLCMKLGELASQLAFLIVPGGGPLADAVRRLDEAFHLRAETAHWMAIMAMDQYGLLLASLTPKAQASNSLREALTHARKGKPSIFLPYRLLKRENPLPASWEVTSDSIAAWLAWKIKAESLLLLKDVEGVYHPSRRNLLSKVSASQLEKWRNRTCLDPWLPRLLAKYRLKCLVVSGFHPERVENALKGLPALGTEILA